MAGEEEAKTKTKPEVSEGEPEEETEEKPEFVCPECGYEADSKQGLNSHMGKRHPEMFEERKRKKEGVGEEGIKPPEIARREQIIENLREKLPKIYGISDTRADAIVDGIEDNPSILDNPRSLWYHIMEMCRGTNINTYQLNNALRGIYGENIAPQGQQPPTLGFQGPQTQGMNQLPPQAPYNSYPSTPPYQPYQPQPNPQAQQLQQAETQERIQQSKEEHDMRMKKLEQEIKETSKGGEKERVPVEFGDTTIKVPADLAPLYMMQQQEGGESERIQELRKEIEEERREREKAERKSLEKDIEHLREEIEEQPSLEEQLRSVEALSKRMGYSKTGMSTIDLLNQGISKMDQRAKQLLGRMPPGGGEEFEPEIERTPEERRRKAREIEERMEKSEGVIEAENELIEAASKVR